MLVGAVSWKMFYSMRGPMIGDKYMGLKAKRPYSTVVNRK
jgi:hypothetical protein